MRAFVREQRTEVRDKENVWALLSHLLFSDVEGNVACPLLLTPEF